MDNLSIHVCFCIKEGLDYSWDHQEPNHNLRLHWWRSMSSYSITRGLWVNNKPTMCNAVLWKEPWSNNYQFPQISTQEQRFMPWPGILSRNGQRPLTHWGRVTHICVSKITIIGSDNDLSPDRCQAIIWTNVGILFIQTIGTNFSEILSKIHTFSFKKMHLKMLSAKWRPFCLGLNVLRLKVNDPYVQYQLRVTQKNHQIYKFLAKSSSHKMPIWIF